MKARTILGDVPAHGLGVTYAHEHVILDSPLVEDRFPEIRLHEVEQAITELTTCRTAGVTTMVDAMPCAAGRDPLRLAAVSRGSGIQLIATTGLHSRRWYPGLSWANEADPDVLAELFVADIVEGIDRFDYRGPVVERTDHRAGLIKVGVLGEVPDDRDRRAFEAAAAAHRRTGAPILTHCEEGRGGPAQIELLREAGVPLDHVVLSHTDKVEDVAYHLDLLDSGVYLEYDQALRHAGEDPPPTARLVAEVVAAGYLDRVMLGTDAARRSMWAVHGGSPGLAWLVTGFFDALALLGVDEEARRALVVDNPARFLPLREGAAG